MNNIKNDSSVNPKFNNIILSNLRKSIKKNNENIFSPSLAKTKLAEFNCNSYKKIFCGGSSCLDLKNKHKKIFFNYTVNINKDINENFNLKSPNYNDIKSRKILFNNNQKNNFFENINQNNIHSNRGNSTKKSYNKYNLLLTKNIKLNDDKYIENDYFNKNNDCNYNITLFNKMIKN